MAYPNEGNPVPMTAAQASFYVRKMIHREAKGPGDQERAMQRLEIKYGLGFWTLDHLRKKKAKTCDVTLFARIKAAFADHCGAEAKKLMLEAELAMAVTPNDDVAAIQREIAALQDRLEAAKSEARAA